MPYQRLIFTYNVATMFYQRDGPAERIVVRLGASSVTRAELRAELQADPIEGLRQVIVIDRDGRVGHAFPHR